MCLPIIVELSIYCVGNKNGDLILRRTSRKVSVMCEVHDTLLRATLERVKLGDIVEDVISPNNLDLCQIRNIA